MSGQRPPDLAERAVPEVRELADEYYDDHDWNAVAALPADSREQKVFKAEVWARKAVADDALPERLPFLRDLARDENWRVREGVAMALKYVVEYAFTGVEDELHEWATHEDNYVRRACELGLMRTPAAQVAPALDVFTHLVDDDDDYVKKNCGPFALSSVAATNPDVAREYLDRWSRSDDLRTRWNVAKSIGGAYGRTDTDHALELAHRLAGDDEYRVRRATASSLKKLIEAGASIRERIESWENRDGVRSML